MPDAARIPNLQSVTATVAGVDVVLPANRQGALYLSNAGTNPVWFSFSIAGAAIVAAAGAGVCLLQPGAIAAINLDDISLASIGLKTTGGNSIVNVITLQRPGSSGAGF